MKKHRCKFKWENLNRSFKTVVTHRCLKNDTHQNEHECGCGATFESGHEDDN